jgi:uncharacterized membrane protein YraQ (UPF0718 family)
LLARFRSWFLFGAFLVCAILFAGLIHDFAQPDAASGWFTSRPALPIALLVVGYVLMVLQRLGPRGEE